jgi:hypothetical protein
MASKRSRRAELWSALAVLSGAVLLLAVLIAGTSSTSNESVLDQGGDNREVCPTMPVQVRPSDIHVGPNLIPHQNWVDFPVPTRFAGYVAFCLDDRLLFSGGGHFEFDSGSARFHVATRSVDEFWLTGSLDGLRDPSRWELRLACVDHLVC